MVIFPTEVDTVRVIGGSHRGMKIKSLAGVNTRPTSDFVREALFNIIGPDVSGKDFADVYAGTGAVGIEALSRGAKSATFIEKNAKACNLIRENLKSLDLRDKATVYNMDTNTAFEKALERGLEYDIIFLDPPYDSGQINRSLMFLRGCSLVNTGTLIIAQHSTKEQIHPKGFCIAKQKNYGRTILSFLRSEEIESGNLPR